MKLKSVEELKIFTANLEEKINNLETEEDYINALEEIESLDKIILVNSIYDDKFEIIKNFIQNDKFSSSSKAYILNSFIVSRFSRYNFEVIGGKDKELIQMFFDYYGKDFEIQFKLMSVAKSSLSFDVSKIVEIIGFENLNPHIKSIVETRGCIFKSLYNPSLVEFKGFINFIYFDCNKKYLSEEKINTLYEFILLEKELNIEGKFSKIIKKEILDTNYSLKSSLEISNELHLFTRLIIINRIIESNYFYNLFDRELLEIKNKIINTIVAYTNSGTLNNRKFSHILKKENMLLYRQKITIVEVGEIYLKILEDEKNNIKDDIDVTKMKKYINKKIIELSL